ncbi:hypothetical protein C5167_003868 [Papaver somniferum]|uniref:Uncharacterized protein n=1 Tax=Papaver somniferum TaxID=3469 RepID=A0A4Y7L470_PAPSO|nr:hypothetical protein C5167_003868 [Papaver somniferum]
MFFMEGSLDEMLVKIGMFLLVQALVYLILSNSSNIFSESNMRSLSFKTVRSASIRRIMAVISDLPTNDGDDQPSPSSSPSMGSFLFRSPSSQQITSSPRT